MLENYEFPDVMVSDTEELFLEPKTKAELYAVITSDYVDNGKVDRAKAYFYKVIQLLWSNHEHYLLIGHLSLCERFGDDELVKMARQVMLLLTRLSGKVREELLIILTWGKELDESFDFMKRATEILSNNTFSIEDKEMFEGLMQRYKE